MKHSGRILVVEDSTIVNQHICAVLKASGYISKSAYQGKDAIEILNEDSDFDLILLDLMMETDDAGIKAGKIISRKYSIPIIFLTALTDPSTINEALESLPYGYITKPFEEVNLITTIRVAILKSRSENELRKSDELFHKILGIIDTCLVLTDDGKIVYANQPFEKVVNKNFDILSNSAIEKVLKISVCEQDNLKNDRPVVDFTIQSKDIFKIDIRDQKNRYFSDFSMDSFDLNGRAVSLIVFRDVTERIEQQEIIENHQKENIKFLLEGQSMERSRIAKEIHDSLGQLLNLLKLKIKIAEIQDPEILSLLDQTMEEAVSISENMMPRKIVDFPIETSVDMLVKSYHNKGIKIHFNHSDIPAISNQIVRTNIYRIVQEGVNNSIKYSKSENIFIQMNCTEGLILLTIEDDGIGFNQSKGTGNGMVNMKIRASSIGGNLWVESGEGDGTLIIGEFPMSNMPGL